MSDSGRAPQHDGRAVSYTTLASDHRFELEIKRSRFITVLRRVDTEDAARALVAELRREFYDARHHCSAFILGPDRSIQRSNDDGEPAGTAGTPMLEALAKHHAAPGGGELSDIAAVVVRYFGGILLGAGGLVRAYSASVSQALDGARLLRRQRMRLFAVPAAHTAAGRLENELRSTGVTVLGTDYDAAGTRLTVALEDEPAVLAGFHERLAALTAGGESAGELGSRWVDVG